MNLNFSARKNELKKRKKLNEIKFNIDSNRIVKSKLATKVFRVTSMNDFGNMLDNIAPNIRIKVMINYSQNKFYLFKTESYKKKISSDLETNQLNNQEIAELMKYFYSEECLKWDNVFLKKSKKLKYEISPAIFDVKDNYIINDNRYINGMFIEHLGDSFNFNDILKNFNCWLFIDLYKVDRENILNKIDEMKKDNMLEKRFSSFILNKIDDITLKLKNEVIFQCELKLLSYYADLGQIRRDNALIREKLLEYNCTSYIAQEKVNTRRIFEKCIQPNINMDIIHSLTYKNLNTIIGGVSNV